MATLRDIALRAGVSISTASRALTEHEYVASETRDRVREIARELGYEPNRLARGLRRNQTRMIGLLLADVRGASFASEAAQLLHRQLHDFGYGLMLCAHRHDRETERRYLQMFRAQQVDGVFHLPIASGSAEELTTGPHPVPVIEFLRRSASDKLDAVGHDEQEGASQAMEHLLALGHRRIGVLLGPQRLGSTHQRLAGALRAVDRAGLERGNVRAVHAEHTPEAGKQAFDGMMADRERPTAVFAASASLALGAAIAAKDAGARIPEQVSLVGLGNPEWASLMTPPLTTYTLPLQEIAMTAALLMISRIEKANTAGPARITISGSMQIRESTAPPNR